MRPDQMQWETMSKDERAELVSETMATIRGIAIEIASNLDRQAIENGVPFRFTCEISMIPRRRSDEGPWNERLDS